ncbi:MAG TPA: hypothetical protein VIO11_05015 [Candidatus Methanoperedens sp.]
MGQSRKEIKTKYLGRVDVEKTKNVKAPTEKEIAEVLMKIGGGNRTKTS